MKKPASLVLARAALAALLLVPALVAAVASNTPAPHTTHVDVLVIEHAYTGPTERTGQLVNWRYDGSAMLLEYAPDGDGIFRNGFDDAELSTCTP